MPFTNVPVFLTLSVVECTKFLVYYHSVSDLIWPFHYNVPNYHLPSKCDSRGGRETPKVREAGTILDLELRSELFGLVSGLAHVLPWDGLKIAMKILTVRCCRHVCGRMCGCVWCMCLWVPMEVREQLMRVSSYYQMSSGNQSLVLQLGGNVTHRAISLAQTVWV